MFYKTVCKNYLVYFSLIANWLWIALLVKII
jgi:hypothetical protein